MAGKVVGLGFEIISKLDSYFLITVQFSHEFVVNVSGASGASGADTSADSGLSSILHVHERYLSSEDFHEALFFERSPKSAQRKRSRKTSNSSSNKATSSNVSESIKKLSVSQI